MDKIIIKDILARGIIGINESERSQPQDILINLIIETDISQAALTDQIDGTVNYRTITKRILTMAETAHRFTVEALAQDIADEILQDSRVHKVTVRVEKPGAVRFSNSVGVEIERSSTGS